MPKDKGWEDNEDSEAEDIQPLKDRARENIVIPIQTGAPAATMVDLVDAMKDTVAEEVLRAAPMHIEVQDAVLRNTDDASMGAGPPTIRISQPMTSSAQMPRGEKCKRVVLNPNTDGSAWEREKALPKWNRWKDLLPGSSSEWETEEEVSAMEARDVTVPG